jgi:hypothetical protein
VLRRARGAGADRGGRHRSGPRLRRPGAAPPARRGRRLGGLAATTIFVVYLVEERFPSGLYARPGWLWLVFPVLAYWLLRVWRLAVYGLMGEDPVLFALKDRCSLALGAVVLGLVLLAR